MLKDLDIAQKNIWKAQQSQKRQADKHRRPHDFKAGDRVLLNTRNLKLKEGTSRKFAIRWTGPFLIKDMVHENAARLNIPHDWKIHPTFNVSLLKPYRENDEAKFPGRKQDPVLPTTIDSEPEQEVERIIGKKTWKKEVWYLVKWLNYDTRDNTWEPLSKLRNARGAIREYEQCQLTKKKPEVELDQGDSAEDRTAEKV